MKLLLDETDKFNLTTMVDKDGNLVHMTPYHVHLYTRNFEDILLAIERGEFPVGTGEPFPLDLSDEAESIFGQTSALDLMNMK